MCRDARKKHKHLDMAVMWMAERHKLRGSLFTVACVYIQIVRCEIRVLQSIDRPFC